MSQCDFWRVWVFGDVSVMENNPSCVAEHMYLGSEAIPWLGRQGILLFGGRVGCVFRNLVCYTTG